jgi:crossover junction endodeoxyribonuclease RuvC
MRVLGVDPGSTYTGYGVLEEKEGRVVMLGGGRISLPAAHPFRERLNRIYEGLKSVIDEYNPQEMAVEDIFFARNVKSALKLAQVRGVILLLSFQAGIPLREFSPLEVKQAVVGYGRATKEQVQAMVNRLLKRSGPLSYDQSDALALAFCILHQNLLLVRGPALR